MTIRAGRFFRAGTHGQRFSHPGGAYATGIGKNRSLRGARPPTDVEARELMEWDARPENQLHRMSDLMPTSEVQTYMGERSGGVASPPMVSRWITTDRSGMKRHGNATVGGPGGARPNFPDAVTPEEWSPSPGGGPGAGRNVNRDKLWRRTDVERWADVVGVSPDMPISHGGRPSSELQRPVPPPIRTTTVGELISNMDERFKAEGGTLHEPGTKDEHGNPRGKQ